MTLTTISKTDEIAKISNDQVINSNSLTRLSQSLVCRRSNKRKKTISLTECFRTEPMSRIYYLWVNNHVNDYTSQTHRTVCSLPLQLQRLIIFQRLTKKNLEWKRQTVKRMMTFYFPLGFAPVGNL